MVQIKVLNARKQEQEETQLSTRIDTIVHIEQYLKKELAQF